MLELVAIFCIGVYLFSIGWVVSGAAMWGLFGGRSGWVQHEGGHNSLSGVMWIDKRIQEVAIGFGLLTSGNMWNSMHNKHHACPQKAKHDIQLLLSHSISARRQTISVVSACCGRGFRSTPFSQSRADVLSCSSGCTTYTRERSSETKLF